MLYKTDGLCIWRHGYIERWNLHHIYFCVLLFQCQGYFLYFLYWTSICDENLNCNLRFSWFFGLLLSFFRHEDCSECFCPYQSTWIYRDFSEWISTKNNGQLFITVDGMSFLSPTIWILVTWNFLCSFMPILLLAICSVSTLLSRYYIFSFFQKRSLICFFGTP
jgi:hypothetical protein